MMMKKITNLLEVNANDNLGTALIKGATKGYLQGVAAAGLGLGVLALTGLIISNRVESDEEEEEEEHNEQMMKDWEQIKANVEKRQAEVDSI